MPKSTASRTPGTLGVNYICGMVGVLLTKVPLIHYTQRRRRLLGCLFDRKTSCAESVSVSGTSGHECTPSPDPHVGLHSHCPSSNHTRAQLCPLHTSSCHNTTHTSLYAIVKRSLCADRRLKYQCYPRHFGAQWDFTEGQ